MNHIKFLQNQINCAFKHWKIYQQQNLSLMLEIMIIQLKKFILFYFFFLVKKITIKKFFFIQF